MAATTPVRAGPIAVKRLGAGIWVLRLLKSLDVDVVPALRDAFGDAIELDATDVVVDLGPVTTVSVPGAAELSAMVDLMQTRGGALWIASAWPDETGYTLRPIREPAPGGLRGVSAALDRALDAILEVDGEPTRPGVGAAHTAA